MFWISTSSSSADISHKSPPNNKNNICNTCYYNNDIESSFELFGYFHYVSFPFNLKLSPSVMVAVVKEPTEIPSHFVGSSLCKGAPIVMFFILSV